MGNIAKVSPSDDPYYVGITVFLYRSGLLLRDEAPLVADILEECGFNIDVNKELYE